LKVSGSRNSSNSRHPVRAGALMRANGFFKRESQRQFRRALCMQKTMKSRNDNRKTRTLLNSERLLADIEREAAIRILSQMGDEQRMPGGIDACRDQPGGAAIGEERVAEAGGDYRPKPEIHQAPDGMLPRRAA